MISFITNYILVPIYLFFNKFGGLSNPEIGGVLQEMEEKKLTIAEGNLLIDDAKQLR